MWDIICLYYYMSYYIIYFCAYSKGRACRQYKHSYSNSTADKLYWKVEIFGKVNYFASCKNPSPIYLPSKIKVFWIYTSISITLYNWTYSWLLLNIVSFTSSFPIWMPFTFFFLALLHQMGPSVQYWVGVMRWPFLLCSWS